MERILCAAVHFEDGKHYGLGLRNVPSGFVLAGYRHPGILEVVARVLMPNHSVHENATEGFLTSENRFVSREEAYEIAKKAGQFLPDADEYDTKTLMSEDLY